MSILLAACSIALIPAASASAGGTESSPAASPSGQLALLGTWTGNREHISSAEGYRNGPATLKVTQQKGLTFKATMTWSMPGGPITEPLVGAYTPGGNLISGADQEGDYTFSLVNSKTLDYCYVEQSGGYRSVCGRLKKQGGSA
jgi:hypothetical protein